MGKRSSFVNKFYSPSSNSSVSSSPFKKTSTTPILPSVATFGSPIKHAPNPPAPPPPPPRPYSRYSRSRVFRAPHQLSPLETKRYNNTKCALCQDLLTMTLSGEVIVLLECGHMCHKNCLKLMSSDGRDLINCGVCNSHALYFDDDIDNNFDLHISNIPNIGPSFTTPEQLSLDYQPVVKPTSVSTKAPFTPVDQIGASFVINNQLETPPSLHNNPTYDIYKPRINCISETNEPNFGLLNEVSFVLNIKSPQIFNDSQNIKLEELQLKHQVQEFIKTTFEIDNEVGELIMFDKLEISVNGETWDRITAYLFEDYLLLYNTDILVGMLSITSDISSMDFINSKCLILNIAKESLPELQIRSSHEIIVTKWESFISKLMKRELVQSNIYQFTNTCWIDLVDYFDIPEYLVGLNGQIVNGENIQNASLCKILPPPESLPFNLVVAISLVNQSKLSNNEYKRVIQNILRKILKSLRLCDKLGVVFVGVDGLRKPSPNGIYAGCIGTEWSGWEQIINDIIIVPNSFSSHSQEINVAIGKGNELYPFVPTTEKSINKFLILSSNSYYNKVTAIPFHLSRRIEALSEKLSITIIRIGEDYNGIEQFKSITQNFDTPLLRFEDYHSFSNSLQYFIQEMLQKICIPKLTITLQMNKGVKISSLEGHHEVSEKQTLTLNVLDMLPEFERNIIFKVKVEEDFFDNFGNSNAPLVEYTGVWFKNNQLPKKVAHSKIKLLKSNQPPLTPMDIIDDETTNSFSSNNDMIIDIPLLPPLSPSRESSFAKRQTELTIIDHLERAIETGHSIEAQRIINACITLAYGIVRGSLLTDFSDDNNGINLTHSETSGFHMLDWTLAARNQNNVNDTYILQLVDRMKLIILNFTNNHMTGKSYCLDMINSLS